MTGTSSTASIPTPSTAEPAAGSASNANAADPVRADRDARTSKVLAMHIFHREHAGRPIRVAWMLEELGEPYELTQMTREEGKGAEQEETLDPDPAG